MCVTAEKVKKVESDTTRGGTFYLSHFFISFPRALLSFIGKDGYSSVRYYFRQAGRARVYHSQIDGS